MWKADAQFDKDGLVNRVADALAERILVGRIGSSERLRQDSLAFEFGVSQGTVREAFRKLESLKLVESLPRRGVRVTPVDAAGEREIAAMRGTLEVLAIRSIAGTIPAAHIKSLRQILIRGDAAENLFESEAANRDFHIALAQPCGMPRLIAAIAELNLAYSRHVFANAGQAPWKPRYNFDHWRIFEAYTARDFEGASALLLNHIKSVDRAWPKQSNRGNS